VQYLDTQMKTALTRNRGINVFEFGHKWISERFRGNHVRILCFNDQENTLTLRSLNLVTCLIPLSQVFDKTMKKKLYDRLLYIFCSQVRLFDVLQLHRGA